MLPSTAAADGRAAAPARRRAGAARASWRRLLRRRGRDVGLAVVVVLRRRWRSFAPWIAPLRPARDQLERDPQGAVSAAHWFGTDEIGRDVLSRVDLGRARLAAGRRGVGARSRCSLGVPIGLLAGYRRAAGPTR